MQSPALRLTLTGLLPMALLLILTACTQDTGDVLAKAYVAPASLNLRKELSQKNNSVAVLKHGEQVSVIDVRRRFVKIRTRTGAEGWVDAAELLSQQEMQEIGRERERYLALPSEGRATAYETLNIHLEPSRSSPAFTQIAEGGAVEVLAGHIAPKLTGPRKPTLLIQRPQPPARKGRKEKQSRSSRLPPPPAPPKVPDDWRQVWGVNDETEAEPAKPVQQTTVSKKSVAPSKPVVMESWTLVRTQGRQVGWVLAHNLMMAIPDEVAQYAEGKRITSYFALETVNDEEKGVHHDWLWTTASETIPNDYDGWRVFLWNRRRHRYETSYRERDVEGYFPVHIDPADEGSPSRTFELITKDDDGKFRRRTYMFDGVRVHLTATENYNYHAPTEADVNTAAITERIQAKTPRKGWFSRTWTSLKERLGSNSAE